MKRNRISSFTGIFLSLIFTASLHLSCTKVNQPTVDFTIDLNGAGGAVLNTKGGYVYDNGVIIARTTTGAYIAVTQICTHDGSTVIFQGPQNVFYCQSDYSQYATSGAVVAGPATKNLKSYNTSVSGNTLRVWG